MGLGVERGSERRPDACFSTACCGVEHRAELKLRGYFSFVVRLADGFVEGVSEGQLTSIGGVESAVVGELLVRRGVVESVYCSWPPMITQI